MIPSDELLACAIATAKAAGTHAFENQHRRNEVFQSLRFDVKLMLDIESQQKAEEVIRARFPDHDVLGEEDQEESERLHEYEWIIDPIDGTVNFSHGLPMWCSSVAVRKGDKVVAGAVYAPVMDELYAASIDTPATLNGEPIHVSTVSDLKKAMITTGLNRTPDTVHCPFEVLEALAGEVQKVRLLGSAALDLCRVARGHCEAYFESGVYIWDIAAAELIVTQAGGQCEAIARETKNRYGFLGTNGHLHAPLKTVLERIIT
jgi:myo-inositol-1(or 4)-monophosphatase